MRVGATVLLRNQECWQSYGWSLKRPLGSLQGVIDALDEYECDEISVIRPIRENEQPESFLNDVQVLKRTLSSTPMSFGGGIRTVHQVALLEGMPIERVVLTSAFLNCNTALLENIKCTFGRQSIQCLLPCVMKDGRNFIYYPEARKYVSIECINKDFFARYANEIIIYDLENEGMNDKFNRDLLHGLPFSVQETVLSGGIGIETLKWAKSQGVAACLIDNRVLHSEFSIKGYKRAAKL